jgi:hypothetical protein
MRFNRYPEELGNSRHTLCMYCGRYIRITSENTQVYLSKDWSQLMDLAGDCIDMRSNSADCKRN